MSKLDINKQPREAIASHQHSALAAQLQYLQLHSPYYKELFQEHHIAIENIRTIADLAQIPTTSKENFSSRNTDFLCVPRSAVIDYATTSGTLGRPVTVALTATDLDRLARNEAQSFAIATGSATDLYQLMVTMDRQFMAGLAYFTGIRMLGAGVIRLGPASPQLQWQSIMAYQPNAIIVVPSFILKLIDYAEANNIDLKKSGIEKAICIGEPIRTATLEDNTLAKRIREKWDIKLYSTYASTEMQTAFTECEYGCGGHQQADLIIVEILDEQGDQVQPGEYGEVTITTLGVEGMPLLRYRTGDIGCMYDGPCSCGRNTPRLSPVIGRKNQMIKYNGTTLFPNAIFDALRLVPEVTDYLVEISKDEFGHDDILVSLHHTGDDTIVGDNLTKNMKAAIKVVPRFTFVSSTQMQQMKSSEGRKPVSVIFK